MKVTTGQVRAERELLITAVQSHLASTHWMPGMPGMDYEARDEFVRLLEKMQRDAKFEADYSALVADLVEDGLESVWACNLAHEWLLVRDSFEGHPESIQRSVLLSRLVTALLTDDFAHELTERLFARLEKNAERDAVVVSG